MATFTGASGKTYKIVDRPFAGGGEGDIFDIVGDSSQVAKIYKADKRTTERERKLSAMVKIKPSVIEQYSWPLDVLYSNGKFAGYIMPKVVGKEKLRNIYVYDKRKGNPWTLYIAIAKNLSSAVYNVHEIGQVIGDLNPENILVDPRTGLVTLVDTDSYHIADQSGNVHRCGVGMPEYVAPELQGKHFPSAQLPTFTKETDLFSLSVLIFSLLMNGAHPFVCKTISGSSSKFQPIDNLASGTCAYFMESSAPNIDIPRYAPALESLPTELQALFKRAFVAGHKNPKLRPTAEEYYNVLETLENHIKVCTTNSEHLYYDNGNYGTICPWCKVNQKMKSIGQSAFVAGAIPSSSGSQAGTPIAPVQPSGYAFRPGTTATTAKHNNWWKPLAGVAAVIVLISIIANTMGNNKENPSVPVFNEQPQTNADSQYQDNNWGNADLSDESTSTPLPTPDTELRIDTIAENSIQIESLSNSPLENVSANIETINGSISYDDQVDTYNFTPAVTGRYRFEIQGLTKGTNNEVNLAVNNSGGGNLDSTSYGISNGDGLTIKDMQAGETYQIQVKEYSGFDSYQLIIGHQKETIDISDYTIISDSIQYTDQRNVYLFTPQITGRYRFEISGMTKGTNNEVDLLVFNSGGGVEDQTSYGIMNGDGLTIRDMQAGQTYEIQVRYYSGYDSYNLNIGLQKETIDISDYTIISDSIQYTDQRNVYLFTPSRSGKYSFIVTGIQSNAEVNILVFNSGDGDEGSTSYGVGNEDGLTIESLNADESYQIQVRQYSGITPYKLSIIRE